MKIKKKQIEKTDIFLFYSVLYLMGVFINNTKYTSVYD